MNRARKHDERRIWKGFWCYCCRPIKGARRLLRRRPRREARQRLKQRLKRELNNE